MNINAPAKPLRRHAPIHEIEQLAKENSIAHLKVKWIQFSLVSLEFVLYSLTFLVLFLYKVLPEYPSYTWNGVGGLFKQIPVLDDYALFYLCYICMFFLVLYQKQYYKLDKERSLSDELGRIIATAFICFLITVGITFLMKNTMIYSRVMLTLFLMLIIIEACFFRQARKWILVMLKRKGAIRQNILIVGAGRVGRQLKSQMEKAQSGATIIGFLDDKEKGSDIIGEISQLEAILMKKKVDTLYITIPSARETINPLLDRIYKYQLDIRIIPEHFDHISSVYEYRYDYQFPCLQIVKTPLRGINLLIKRFMDISLSLLGLLIISPLLLIIALLIKLTSKGPVLYKQKRIGQNALPFMMYKFRTMVVNADQLKSQLVSQNEASGPVFKLKNDPRVTRIGALLRKYSIDELPQLLNVLRGNMSLIGPRPPLSDEVQQYTDVHWRRLDVRPGMTGLWQVSGRSDLDFDEWVDLDIHYIEHWSIGLELKILLKTIPVVIKGSGAY